MDAVIVDQTCSSCRCYCVHRDDAEACGVGSAMTGRDLARARGKAGSRAESSGGNIRLAELWGRLLPLDAVRSLFLSLLSTSLCPSLFLLHRQVITVTFLAQCFLLLLEHDRVLACLGDGLLR